MRTYSEKIFKQSIVEKVLCTLTLKYDHIVVTTEESKDLDSLKIEELQSSLEAYEQRLRERNPDKSGDQALQAQARKLHGENEAQRKGKGKWKSDRWKNQDGSR